MMISARGATDDRCDDDDDDVRVRARVRVTMTMRDGRCDDDVGDD